MKTAESEIALSHLLKKLLKIKKESLDHLLLLANRVDELPKWKDLYYRIFNLYPAGEIIWFEKEFTEDLYPQMAFWLMRLLSENTSDEILKSLNQALYRPQEIISEPSFIGGINVAPLLQSFTKIAVLTYLVEHYSDIQAFIDVNNTENNKFPGLSKFSLAWLENQIEHAQLKYFKNDVSPEITWKCFWNFHLSTPLRSRFAIGRLFSLEQPRNMIDPFPTASFFTKLGFRLLFWLHIPLFLSILKKGYWKFSLKHFSNVSQYIMGKKPLLSIFKITFNITLFACKLLFSPIILFGPIVQGLTSLPFTFFRSFIQLFRTDSLFKEYFLAVSDYLETAKDLILLTAILYTMGVFVGSTVVLSAPLAWIANSAAHFATLILISFLVTPEFNAIQINELYLRHFNRFSHPFFGLLAAFVSMTTLIGFSLMIVGRLAVNVVQWTIALKEPLKSILSNLFTPADPVIHYSTSMCKIDGRMLELLNSLNPVEEPSRSTTLTFSRTPHKDGMQEDDFANMAVDSDAKEESSCSKLEKLGIKGGVGKGAG